MKKKIIALLSTMVLTTTMLFGCGSTSASTQASSEESAEVATEAASDDTAEAATEVSTDATADGELLASIKASGKIVVGTASGYPPYEFVDITSADQSIIGVDIEFAQAIADEIGVELEIQDMSFSSLLSSLPAHKIDVAIAGIAPTDERKESMDFSDVYLTADQKFLILKSNADKYATIDSFKGETLAAEKSTTQEALCQTLFPDNQLVSIERVPDCIMELKNGNVAGVCVESIVGEQYVLSDSELAFADADTGAQKYSAVALEKGNEDLVAIINKVIKEHTDNGDFDKWVEEYSEKAAENAAD